MAIVTNYSVAKKRAKEGMGLCTVYQDRRGG